MKRDAVVFSRAVTNKNPALAYTATFTGSLSAESNERTRSASDCYCGEVGLSCGTARFILVRYFYLPLCLRSTEHYVFNIYERPICTTERMLHALLADHCHISSFLLRCYSTALCSVLAAQIKPAGSFHIFGWDFRNCPLETKCLYAVLLSSQGSRTCAGHVAKFAVVLFSSCFMLACFSCCVPACCYFACLVIRPSRFFSSVSISALYSVVISFWFRICALLVLSLDGSNARIRHFYIVMCGVLLLLPFTYRPRFLKARVRRLTPLGCIVHHRPSSSTCSTFAASHSGISTTGTPP